MPKYTSRNVSDTSTACRTTFLAFDSISKHFHHTNHSPVSLDLVLPR